MLHVKRIKGSRASVHTLKGDEVRALRQLHREAKGPHVFETERGGPFTRDALNKQLKNIAERAGFANNAVHFHMLRHGCGYALANKGHDTRAIQQGRRSSARSVTDIVKAYAERVGLDPALFARPFNAGPASNVRGEAGRLDLQN